MAWKIFNKKKSLQRLLSEKNKEQQELHTQNEESHLIKSASFFKKTFLDFFRSTSKKPDQELTDLIEETFLKLDFGPFYSSKISESISRKLTNKDFSDLETVRKAIKEELIKAYYPEGRKEDLIDVSKDRLNVFLIVGANGSGKTTSIAKLVYRFQLEGFKVLIIAADTFRAGAVEQLNLWAKKLNTDIVAPEKHKEDPSSLIYKGLSKTKETHYDLVICDTSGKQHNNKNLLQELTKIYKTIKKFDPSYPHETLLIVDSTIGQSSFLQTKSFLDSAQVTGIILSKMDTMTRGGIIFSIKEKFKVPVKLVGTGERLEDLHEFDLDLIVDFWLKNLEIPTHQIQNGK